MQIIADFVCTLIHGENGRGYRKVADLAAVVLDEVEGGENDHGGLSSPFRCQLVKIAGVFYRHFQ